jgi:SAM-dependent methyltransferase
MPLPRPLQVIRDDFATEDDPRVDALRRRLDQFYADTDEYTSFQQVNDKPEFWAPIYQKIERTLRHQPTCRVLELGAGRSGFAGYLGPLRAEVHYTAQDVTPANEAFLRQQADALVIGDVAEVEGQFDVIFSTFVWEHITDPRQTLARLLSRLGRGGTLFIACPRYDWPGRLSPSARHYPALTRAALGAWLWTKRMGTCLTGRPSWLIHLNPAVLHQPWFRDADAIHWASAFDLKRALPENYTIRWVPRSGASWKARLLANRIDMFLRIDPKPTASAPQPQASAS